ncbi:PSF3 [Candida theae]|uniref:DNA replication complex GINS protein PSF3 n=1 Tax=Candida theae TaxID=1198502 RepID=A0AAD5BDK2_9ASCO|nr:PSF3 [Candida theae]KAI5956078.1 PSF3 [Candida theae]
MSYYDIDDILADAEKLPCQFNHTIPGLGYLEGNPGKPIQQNTKLELPFWLAEILAVLEVQNSDSSFISLIDPDFINDKVLNAIKSDALSLDLHKLSGQYYSMIEKWGKLFTEPRLIEQIMEMLKVRSFEINNYASNIHSKHFNTEFIYTLDEFEKKLFRDTSESNKLMRQWLKE